MTNVKELYSNGEETKPELMANTSQPSVGTIEDLLAKYLIDFTIEEDTVLGYINDLDTFKEVVGKMNNLGFAFSVRDSDVRHKQREKTKKVSANGNINDGESGSELYYHPTFFYQFKAMPIRFFGLPFTIDKTTHYQCAYGCLCRWVIDYLLLYFLCANLHWVLVCFGCQEAEDVCRQNPRNTEKNGAGDLKVVKKKKTVGSKKIGCLAKMTIKHITVYPEYKLDIETDWRKKKKLIENLRKDLSDSSKVVEQFRRFYLSVSVQSSHNHPPIIVEPKPPKSLKSMKLLKVKKNKKKYPLLTEENCSAPVAEESDWNYAEMASSSVNDEQAPRGEFPSKPLNLKDESFFHTLVKFPNTTSEVFEEVEYKHSEIEIEVKPYEFTGNTSTIEIYEYQPTIQDLQTLFKEKLKNLYTLCTNCSNGSLILKLAGELEQVELQLSNDVNYSNL